MVFGLFQNLARQQPDWDYPEGTGHVEESKGPRFGYEPIIRANSTRNRKFVEHHKRVGYYYLRGCICSFYFLVVDSILCSCRNLESNGLTGALPAELGNLKSLVELRLDRNKLQGTVPAHSSADSVTNFHGMLV